MRTPRGYRRLANGLLKKSSAGGRKKKAGRKRKVGGRRKRVGRGRRKQRGRGVAAGAAIAGKVAIKYAPIVAKKLAPFVLPVIGDAVAKGLKKVLNPKKKGSGLRRHGGGLKRHGIR